MSESPMIFVSHSMTDRQDAGALTAWLRKHNFQVWYDRGGGKGDAWRRRIRSAIEEATLVISIWSPAAMRSRAVLEEAQLAAQHEKLMPLFVGAFSWQDAPSRIWSLANRVTCLDMSSSLFRRWLRDELGEVVTGVATKPMLGARAQPPQVIKTTIELARCQESLGRRRWSAYGASLAMDAPGEEIAAEVAGAAASNVAYFPLVAARQKIRRVQTNVRVSDDVGTVYVLSCDLDGAQEEFGGSEEIRDLDKHMHWLSSQHFADRRAQVFRVQDKVGKIQAYAGLHSLDWTDVIWAYSKAPNRYDTSLRLLLSLASLDVGLRERPLHAFCRNDVVASIFMNWGWTLVPESWLPMSVRQSMQGSRLGVKIFRAPEHWFRAAAAWLRNRLAMEPWDLAPVLSELPQLAHALGRMVGEKGRSTSQEG